MKTRILHNSNWNQQFIILYTKKIQPLATKATNTIFYHLVIWKLPSVMMETFDLKLPFGLPRAHITKKEQLQVVSQLKRTCMQAWLLGAQTILNSSTSQVSWFWCPKMNRDVFFIHINEYRLFTHVNDMQMVDFQGVTAAIWSQVYHVWSHAKGVCVEMKEALWISALSSRTI